LRVPPVAEGGGGGGGVNKKTAGRWEWRVGGKMAKGQGGWGRDGWYER